MDCSNPTIIVCTICSKQFFSDLNYFNHCLSHSCSGSSAHDARFDNFSAETSLENGLSSVPAEFSGKYANDLVRQLNEQSKFSGCQKRSKFFIQPKSSISVKKSLSKQSKGKIYVCSVCQSCFPKASVFKKHYLTHMVEIKLPSSYNSKQAGVINSVHNSPLCLSDEESSFSCKICNDKFASNTELSVHSRSHVKKDKYSCKICGKVFFRIVSLVIHRLSHNVKKSFSCQTCEKSFSSELLLTLHKRTHYSQTPLSCKKCPQTFLHKIALIEHYKSCHQIRCEFCDKIFSNENNLRNHVLIHIEESMNGNNFSCDKCGKMFDSKDLLKTHQFIHKVETGCFPCCKCERVFTSQQSLKRHEEYHKGIEVKKYSCDKCEAKFANEHSFRDHRVMHSDPDRFVCDICGLKYLSRSTLYRHHRAKHRIDKSFSCSECPNKFLSELSLKKHMKSHVGLKPYSCNLCDKSFTMLSNLNRHRSVTHAGKKPFVCSICGKGYPRRENLVEHMRSHTGEKPFACEFCNKAFRTKTCLTQHRYVHTGEKSFVCESCGLCYANKGALAKHLARHAGDDPTEHRKGRKISFEKKVIALGPDQFYYDACNICGKSFFTEHSFQNHMLKHEADAVYLCHICSGEFITEDKLKKHVQRMHSNNPKKELACTYCKKKFSDTAHLKRHELMHTGEKLFECNLCYRRFTTKLNLTVHLKNQVCLKNSKGDKNDLSDRNE